MSKIWKAYSIFSASGVDIDGTVILRIHLMERRREGTLYLRQVSGHFLIFDSREAKDSFANREIKKRKKYLNTATCRANILDFEESTLDWAGSY
jgi:hypothetical protein